MSDYIDYLKEKEKSIVCVAAGIAALLSAALIPFAANSIFCKNYVAMLHGEGVVSIGFYVLSIGLVLLGTALLLLSGSARRGRKLLELKKVLSDAQQRSGRYVSVGELTDKTRDYSLQERKMKVLRNVVFSLIIGASLCFAVLLFYFEIKALVVEFSKEDIDRTVTAFRLWADFSGRLIAYSGLVIAAFSSPKIMNNRPVKKEILYVAIGCLAISAVQLVYHYFGIIWLHPSLSDMTVATLLCLLAGLCVLSLVSENIKSTIRSMGNNQGDEY